MPKLCLEKKVEGDERRGKCSNNIKAFSPVLLKYFFILKHKLFVLTFLFAWHKQFWKWKKTPKQYKAPMKLNTAQNNFLCYYTVWYLFLENFETSGFIPKGNKTYSEITICFVKKNANPLIELLFTKAGGFVQKESLDPTLHQLDKPQGIQGESLRSFHSSLHWKEKEIPSLCTDTPMCPQQEKEIIFNYWELLMSKRLG